MSVVVTVLVGISTIMSIVLASAVFGGSFTLNASLVTPKMEKVWEEVPIQMTPHLGSVEMDLLAASWNSSEKLLRTMLTETMSIL